MYIQIYEPSLVLPLRTRKNSNTHLDQKIQNAAHRNCLEKSERIVYTQGDWEQNHV